MEQSARTCKKCTTIFTGDYCSTCGTPYEPKRINGRYILTEIGSVLNFDKGILYTIRELVLRPGASIRQFIHEDRNRLVKPIIFLILCSLIYSIVERMFHIEESYIHADMKDSAVSTLFEWIKNNYGYSNIIMGIFIGLWTKVLFRKSGFNIYEILILIFFTMGIGMLIYTLFGIIESLIKLKILHIGGAVGVGYAVWAIGQFFDKKKITNYLKSLASYMLGMITFMLIAILLGITIDLIA